MSSPTPAPASAGLPPPGQRWGRGARSVVPYLVHSVQARASAAEIVIGDAQPIRNPVFPGMEIRVVARAA